MGHSEQRINSFPRLRVSVTGGYIDALRRRARDWAREQRKTHKQQARWIVSGEIILPEHLRTESIILLLGGSKGLWMQCPLSSCRRQEEMQE